MVVVDDDRRREPVAEEVAVPVVAAVERLSMSAVHPLHPRRERREHALDDEVEVRVEQAPRDDPPLALDDLAGEEAEQEEAISIVTDDRDRVHAEDRHVVRADWREVAARDSRHGPRRYRRSAATARALRSLLLIRHRFRSASSGRFAVGTDPAGRYWTPAAIGEGQTPLARSDTARGAGGVCPRRQRPAARAAVTVSGANASRRAATRVRIHA
jgi:hypothetical protein